MADEKRLTLEAATHKARANAAEKERDDQSERLRLAERVCTLYAWGAMRGEGEREDATHQAWSEWLAVAGSEAIDPICRY